MRPPEIAAARSLRASNVNAPTSKGTAIHRVGALTLVATDPKSAETAFGHMKSVIRVIYSNPAAHGGAIVTTILKKAELLGLWERELTTMRRRIATVRSTLVAELKRRGAIMDFSFINRQRGMFSFSGLSDAQEGWCTAIIPIGRNLPSRM